MAGEPDIGVWVEFGDVAVEFGGGLIIPVLSSESLDEAGLVASESGRGAITDLSPQVMAALGATAAEEEIIVDLVLGGRAGTVEDGGGGAFESDDDRLVALICEDVTAQAIALPSEGVGVVESGRDVFPLAGAGFLVIGIPGHYGEIDDGFFVSNVRAGNLVEGPG